MNEMSEKSDDLVQIQVMIADRQYPLRIKKGEEDTVRRAVTLVNDKLKEYQESYSGKDKQDYLSMCVLMFAVEYQTLKNQSQLSSNVLNTHMQQLHQILDEALS
jgi:cell division protein ZapA (FtsZ GTPase activity inhibitor)